MRTEPEQLASPRQAFLLASIVLVMALGAILPSRNSEPVFAAGVLGIDAAGAFTCAITGARTVKCWGDNQYGELGNGSTKFGSGNFSLVPVDVCADGTCASKLSNVTSIATGDYHACAITAAGGVKCWGENTHGQLGDGTNEWSSTPVDVTGLSSGVASVTGGTGHTCALMVSGGMKCWGRDALGELGNGANGPTYTPEDVMGLTSGVSAITAGGHSTCAIITGGGVKCWGGNHSGQLGNGTTSSSNVPTTVNVSSAVAIRTGHAHTCVITAEGGVKCWGQNTYCQLGDSSSETCAPVSQNSTSPVDVVGLSISVTEVALSGQRTCALTRNEGVKCWGEGYGTTPVDIVGLTSAVAAVTESGIHSCVVLTAGGVRCWGTNHVGQLGDGTTTDSGTPVDVDTLGSKALTPTDPPAASATLDAPTAVPSNTPGPSVLTGDTNCDGRINAIDATLILQLVAGMIADLDCLRSADTNSDGSVNSVDATIILQYAAGMIDSLERLS